MALNSSGNVALMFYQLLCFLICDKNRNLASNRRFLLQTKCKEMDKTLEQHFLKEFNSRPHSVILWFTDTFIICKKA